MQSLPPNAIMFDHIDSYCERLAPGFWGEPLNAITNLSFLVAAFLIARSAARSGTLTRPGLLVPLLFLAATGIGSFLFHTFANGWSAIADTAALTLCLLATFFAGARRWLGASVLIALVWTASIIVVGVVIGAILTIPGALYLGPLTVGFAMVWALRKRGHAAAPWVTAAVLVFIPSFLARSLDMPLCGELPFGTHFIWHILNGIVLGLAIAPLAWPDRGGAEEYDTGIARGA